MESKDVGLLDTLLRPVIRRRLDAPYIPWLIQRQSEKPKLFVLPHGNAIHYSRSDLPAGRKFL